MSEPLHIDPRALLGQFGSDLHFPLYRPATRGPWTIRMIGMAAAPGYWGETYPIAGAVILTGPADADTLSWMSILPSELEGQEIGLRGAHGHTVVFGLGMGWLAANLAMRPEVERLTVVERDPDVIGIVADVGVFEQLPLAARRKVTVIEADALQWRPDAKVDTLQADIWCRTLEDQKLEDVRRMQRNLNAERIYFWGQEAEIWRHACRRADAAAELDWPTIRTIVAEDIRLPLILPDWPDYPAKIMAGSKWWAPSEPGWWR